MITKEQLNLIKSHLNRSASTIFVIGQGVDFSELKNWKNKTYQNLYSDNHDIMMDAWNEMVTIDSQPLILPFISNYTRYVKNTSPVDVAKFFVLNTAITIDVGDCDENTQVINLNGLIHKGICEETGVSVDVNGNVNGLYPTFIPISQNYKPFKEIVGQLETVVTEHAIRSIFFIGTSGKCPVVESLFNRSLLRSITKDNIFKCVVNINETFMDEEADIVIKADGIEFLNWLSNTTFIDGENYFNDKL